MGGYCLGLMICVIRSGIRIFNANTLCDLQPSQVIILTVWSDRSNHKMSRYRETRLVTGQASALTGGEL